MTCKHSEEYNAVNILRCECVHAALASCSIAITIFSYLAQLAPIFGAIGSKWQHACGCLGRLGGRSALLIAEVHRKLPYDILQECLNAKEPKDT